MDRIFIQQLRLDMIIGVYEFERTATQPIYADLTLYPKHPLKDLEDDLSKTIDYAAVCAGLLRLSSHCNPQLLETFADLACAYILDNYAVQQVLLTLYKPQAVANAANVGITVTRDCLLP